MAKELTIADYIKDGGDALKWTRLPIINGHRVLSISCDFSRNNWNYVCYADPTGVRARELASLGNPPQAFFQMFGPRNIRGVVRMVIGIKFNITHGDRSVPGQIITIRCRTEKLGFYAYEIGNLWKLDECEYGRRLYAIINKRFTIKTDNK
jgi:hypothetical protein